MSVSGTTFIASATAGHEVTLMFEGRWIGALAEMQGITDVYPGDVPVVQLTSTEAHRFCSRYYMRLRACH